MNPAATDEERRLRRLLGHVYTALLAAGWRDDELMQRVKADADVGSNPAADQAAQAAAKEAL